MYTTCHRYLSSRSVAVVLLTHLSVSDIPHDEQSCLLVSGRSVEMHRSLYFKRAVSRHTGGWKDRGHRPKSNAQKNLYILNTEVLCIHSEKYLRPPINFILMLKWDTCQSLERYTLLHTHFTIHYPSLCHGTLIQDCVVCKAHCALLSLHEAELCSRQNWKTAKIQS